MSKGDFPKSPSFLGPIIAAGILLILAVVLAVTMKP